MISDTVYQLYLIFSPRYFFLYQVFLIKLRLGWSSPEGSKPRNPPTRRFLREFHWDGKVRVSVSTHILTGNKLKSEYNIMLHWLVLVLLCHLRTKWVQQTGSSRLKTLDGAWNWQSRANTSGEQPEGKCREQLDMKYKPPHTVHDVDAQSHLSKHLKNRAWISLINSLFVLQYNMYYCLSHLP